MTATVKRCGNCAYWRLIARSDGGPVKKALCLRAYGEGPYALEYTTASQSCRAWEGGEHIDAIDGGAQ